MKNKGLIIGSVVVLAILVALFSTWWNRGWWIARIKKKWGERFGFLLGDDGEPTPGTYVPGFTQTIWLGYSMAQLRRIHAVGEPWWFAEGTEEHALALKSIPNKLQRRG